MDDMQDALRYLISSIQRDEAEAEEYFRIFGAPKMIGLGAFLDSQQIAGMFPYIGNGLRIWVMPDGTKTVHRPKDGVVVLNTDPNTGLDVYWQWDDCSVSWFNVTTGPTTNHNTATFIVPPYQKDGYHLDNDFEIKKTPKCECGSDAVGSPRHSSWCQKYDSKQ